MFMEPYWSDVDGKPFLTRFVFWFNPRGGCHVTFIHQPDNQREWPHDHSASFVSVKLIGGYEEDVYSGSHTRPDKRHRKHRWLSCHVMHASEAHSITRTSRILVTLVILGQRVQPSNYWTPQGLKSIGLRMDDEWG
jgi:hypothetical protein